MSDFWSAGDKGRSKQPIPGMGDARHRCALQSFMLAENAHMPTHFISEDKEGGFIVEEFAVPTHEPLSGTTAGEVLNGEWIWRLKNDGSLADAIERGEIDPVTLGYPAGYIPDRGDPLPRMHLKCWTKFERIDRPLEDEEARDLMQLSMAEWDEAWELVNGVVRVTVAHAKRCGYDEFDGKCELARRWNQKLSRRLLMADTFGTQDENRIKSLRTGELFCKDLIRNYLKEIGWWALLKAAQKEFPDDPSKWPEYPELPPELVALVSDRYTIFADDYCS